MDFYRPGTGCFCEENYEEKFLEALCELIVAVLRVNYSDRSMVKKLIYTSLWDEVAGGRSPLLEQYLHSQLDILIKTLKKAFDLDDAVQLNYNYATHAKFFTLIEALKEKFILKEKAL